MGKFAFVIKVIAAGGLLFLCAAPQAVPGPSSQAGAAPAPMQAASAPTGKSATAPDLLEGLTLADDQKARIGRIRGDTNARLAALEGDSKLSPEAAEAMRRGYERLENGRILEVLTPEQQRLVRMRIAAWRDARAKPQYPLRPTATPEQPSRPQ
jgi:hypothetical protein